MTLEQLQYFVAIVESATFFDAAESLHIAQSTLSKQIRNLELELDVQLFDRSRRPASLTDAGRILYPDAVKLLKGVQGMEIHPAFGSPSHPASVPVESRSEAVCRVSPGDHPHDRRGGG